MSSPKFSTHEKKSAARLAAVQALYQFASSESSSRKIAEEFIEDRRGHEIEDEEYIPFQKALFESLFFGVIREAAKLDLMIEPYYKADLNQKHLGKLFHIIIQAASYETLEDQDIHTSVLISEYVQLIDSLFHGQEAKVGNAMLDKLIPQIRAI